jgi:hypothetical protein
MANTTNYNWETPDDTDLVKDGAAAIRTLGSSVDTTTKALNPSTTLGDIEYRSATANTNTRLGIGTTGQVLTVAGGVPSWATSDDANAIQNAIVDAKGDLVAASAADTPARLAVGTDNQRLVAASGEATGLKYVSDTQNTVVDAAGDLVYGTAADTLGRLAIGTAGQVLKVNSGATAPEWGAAGGGSGLTLISRVSFSNVASQAFDAVFSSTYKAYLVELEGITAATSTDDLQMQMRYSGTTETAGYYTSNAQIAFNSATVVNQGNSNSSVIALTDDTGSTNNETIGNLSFYRVGQASSTASVIGNLFNLGLGAQYRIGVSITTQRAYTGFLLKSSSSNITGTVAIYGLASA